MTFDGSVSLSTEHQRPDRYRHLETDLGGKKRIARGGGFSYVAASFGQSIVVQEMSAFNRLLAFDERNRTLRLEAGTTLEQLLTWSGQKNLYLPVLPGYPLITVGGCIAADAHGKNPLRDGTFCDWVQALTVFHPARGFQMVTRIDHPGLFEATCGGYGLTGLVVDATLRLTPMPSKNVCLQRVPTKSLSDSIRMLRQGSGSDFAYSWHDGTARHKAFGRGLLFFGSWTDKPAATEQGPYRPLSAAQRARSPFSLWNKASVRLANTAFLHLATRQPEQVKSAFDAAFPFARQTSYHRFYGRPGFSEVQVLVPDARLDEFVLRLTGLVHDMEPTLVMMSLKRFVGRQQSLSMSGSGMLVALDLARSPESSRFMSALDALVLSLGAQPNIGKDSRLPSETAARALPFYQSFKERIRQLDPDRLYQSELSRRLAL